MTQSPTDDRTTAMSMLPLPAAIRDAAHLDELLSEPTPGVIATLARHKEDVIVLGAAGKMGPSLTRMIRRAADASGTDRRIIAVSRFTSPDSEAQFRRYGIETIRCDLLDQSALEALPEVPNVVYMAGTKFGTIGNEAMTWAMNSYLPGMVCTKFRHSKIVAFGTGNVYPLSPVTLGGSVETDPTDPTGDYAQSCLGRERILEHFSRTRDIPVAILRLNYAIAIRYGVLVDVAKKVWNDEPVSLAMGAANVIWQADANAMALRAFDHVASPPFVVNLAGPEQVSIRRVAQQYGELLGKTPVFVGEEAQSALLSNGQLAQRLFGYPHVGVQQMLHWIVDWIRKGGEDLGKPTHFEVRDGKF